MSNLSGKGGYVRIVVPTRLHILLKVYAKERGIPLRDATVELLGVAFRQVYKDEDAGD